MAIKQNIFQNYHFLKPYQFKAAIESEMERLISVVSKMGSNGLQDPHLTQC